MIVGYLLAFATSWLFALSDIMVRMATRSIAPWGVLLITLLAGSPILGFSALMLGEARLPYEGLLAYGAIGVLHFYLGRLMFYTAVAGLGAASSAIIVSPTPLVSSALAYALLGESLSLQQVAGLTVVSIAVYMAVSHPSGKPLGEISRAKASAAGLLAIAIFSATTVAVRWASQEFGSPLTGALASYTGALVVTTLHTILAIMRGLSLFDTSSTQCYDCKLYALAAGVSVALAQGSRYLALSMIPVAEAVALISLFPINTVILASAVPASEEKVRPRHLVAAVMAVLGVIATLEVGL